jgi:hypothetical protein
LPLHVGFDVDGVLADMESELARQAELLFGTRPAASDPSLEPRSAAASATSTWPRETVLLPGLGLGLTGRQQQLLWRHVAAIPSFWESLKEIEPGAVALLAATAAERRWRIVFLTARPESAPSTQRQTERWLESHGFALPNVFLVQGSRGRVATALGLHFVIDDRPENCVDVLADSKSRPILVWRGDTQRLPEVARRLGIGVVRSTSDCIVRLAEIDASVR